MPRLRRPQLGSRVKIGAIMMKGEYRFDCSKEDLLAGPRWVREEWLMRGVYCGVKRLHQANLYWTETSGPSDCDAFLNTEAEGGLITVYIVALDHERRVNVLPADVEVIDAEEAR